MTVSDTPRIAASAYDFKIYTASIDVKEADIPTMRSTSSSTIKDLQGDAMHITALQDMERAPDNQNVFLNHEQRIPEDLMGGLTSSKIVMEKGIADLIDTFEVDQVNPRAMAAYEQGKRRRLGVSIGGIVLDYHIEDEKGMPVCIIDHILLLERSIVGIPAVQRAWVENAALGAFRRSYDPELAPIAKSLWPQVYSDIVAGMDNADQREYFTKGVTARDMGKQRIVWYPAQKQFSIETPNATRPAFLSREAVTDMLNKSSEVQRAPDVLITHDTTLGDTLVEVEKAAMPKANDVAVSDGTHVKCDGTHSHSHDANGDQAGDATHTHSHTHDGDNEHNPGDGHTHDDKEKATEPDKTADVTPEAPAIDVSVSPSTLGTVTPAVSDSTAKALAVPTVPEIADTDPAYMAWKSMGEQLGYLKKAAEPDMQNVVTLVSRLDAITDAMTNGGMYDLAFTTDALMVALGIPDYDIANSDLSMGMWSADKIDALRKTIAAKAGARHNAADSGLIQSMHDMCGALGASCHPNDALQSDAPDSPIDADPSDKPAPGLPGTQMNLSLELQPITTQLEALTKAFSGIDVSVIGANVQKAMEVQLHEAQGAMATIMKDIGAAQKELTDTRAEIATLTNIPLGNPTRLNRTVQAGEPVASYEDFTAIGKSGVEGTRLVKVTDRGLMRLWNAGTSNRPALEPWQDKLMSEGETNAYNSGRECLVPEKE